MIVILAVAVFFWAYAELIMRYVPVIRLSREVNLVPYFLCLLIGLLLGSGRIRALEDKITRLTGAEAAGLATGQVVLIALALFTMMFATLDRDMSRLFLGTFLVWTWLGLTWIHRVLPKVLAGALYGRSERVPTLFIGRAKSLPFLETWLAQRSHLGLLSAGFISLDGESAVSALDGLVQTLDEKSVGQVIFMDLPADENLAREIIGRCQARGCRLLIQHKIDEIVGHPLISVDEGGYRFLALHREPLEEPLNRALKRTFDILVALPVVVLVLPVLIAVVWLIQRKQSPGPLFHVRARSGEARVEFPMLKFRSMHHGSRDPHAEAQQAQAGDARVYPLGRFLRRHSLDEFPQFWNVLTGDMSIVGPRPVMPLLDAEFERQVKAYRSKHWVKPGITGLAQSEGFRGEITTPEALQERIRLDLYYIAHWSIWLDAQITLRTFVQIFNPPKSAY
ncbi:exopolysaccharide biosynthesis polyprenyl glycosylphosphotransferase [Oleiharenicola lentus]|uniref:exopolysaccharide biosynthesis polyprenyl glycosylphosphotransferase n=1 Tax=Oleiharenicola lentus TaxID=2508720 RepID=UPI003F66913E